MIGTHIALTSPRIAMRSVVLALLVAMGAGPALAQGWTWPWEQPRPPPVPRAPVYNTLPSPTNPQQSYTPGGRAPICVQLEQRLASEVNRGSQTRDVLPKIEGDLRQFDLQARQGESQLERGGCYDYFLFAKSLRRTPQCIALSSQVETARRRVAELDTQRQQILGSNGRSYRDDIIRELASNNCGTSYQQEANRNSNPFSSIWQDGDAGAGGAGTQFGTLPFATYRTVCVRLCDGYFFPISFSTLPAHFDTDADLCQSKCAAPAELYYHQNPGAGMEQAVSYKSKQNYTALKSAFRYRKEYVQGCSCKQAEYVAPAGSPAAGGPDRRADGATSGSAPSASPAPAAQVRTR